MTMEKLKTVRDIIPATIDEIILLAVVASFKLNQCNCDLKFFPVSEKSNEIINHDNTKKKKAIIAGRNAILLTILL